MSRVLSKATGSVKNLRTLFIQRTLCVQNISSGIVESLEELFCHTFLVLKFERVLGRIIIDQTLRIQRFPLEPPLWVLDRDPWNIKRLLDYIKVHGRNPWIGSR